MNESYSRKKIIDTLYCRKVQPADSCLIINEAGQELIRQPAEILPLLEQIILETLSPAFQADGINQFPGL